MTTIQGINFYTVREAALDLNVSQQTIRAWLRMGRLRGQRIGRPVYIREESIRAFLKASQSLYFENHNISEVENRG